MNAYTEREKSIIKHYQVIYEQFGKGADTYSVLGFNSPSLGFIYPQELDDLIEKGCTGFIAHVWNGNGLYGHTTYSMHKSIMDIELENEKDKEMSETKQQMNAVEFLNKQDSTITNAGFSSTIIEGFDPESATLHINEIGKVSLGGMVTVDIYQNGKAHVNWFSGSISSDAMNAFVMSKALQLGSSIAMGWEALHATDESLDSEDSSELEDDLIKISIELPDDMLWQDVNEDDYIKLKLANCFAFMYVKH